MFNSKLCFYFQISFGIRDVNIEDTTIMYYFTTSILFNDSNIGSRFSGSEHVIYVYIAYNLG